MESGRAVNPCQHQVVIPIGKQPGHEKHADELFLATIARQQRHALLQRSRRLCGFIAIRVAHRGARPDLVM